MRKAILRELNKDLELDIVIYGDFFYRIGGIESWVYYVCKKYNKGQITIMFKQCDPDQLKRFQSVANCVQNSLTHFHCRKLIYVAPIYLRDDDIYRSADERYLINHVCYGESKNNEYFTNLPLDKVFCVSKFCLESCKLKMNYDMEVMYNPIEIDKPKKLLKLVSACRWSYDKGKEQMERLANMLDDAGIPFIWLVFTDEDPKIHHPNMIFMRSRYDLSSYIKEADYGVQFTRIESYGNFPVECLTLGVPVIVSDIPTFREIGIDEKNAYFYDWEMNGPDVKELLNIPKVNFKPKNSDKKYKELFK